MPPVQLLILLLRYIFTSTSHSWLGLPAVFALHVSPPEPCIQRISAVPTRTLYTAYFGGPHQSPVYGVLLLSHQNPVYSVLLLSPPKPCIQRTSAVPTRTPYTAYFCCPRQKPVYSVLLLSPLEPLIQRTSAVPTRNLYRVYLCCPHHATHAPSILLHFM
jgi:hypothetical protein